MTISPEDEFHQATLWLLDDILKAKPYTRDGEKIDYSIKETVEDLISSPSEDTRRKILYKLKDSGVLTYTPYPADPPDENDDRPRTERVTRFGLEINQKEFDKLYEKLSEKRVTLSKTETSSPEFRSKESILVFLDKPIKISRSQDTAAHYLLSAIFKDPTKLWSYDEIADEMGNEYAKDKWRRYYNAAYAVNEKIAKQTTINDFLSITAKSVQINAKYLK